MPPTETARDTVHGSAAGKNCRGGGAATKGSGRLSGVLAFLFVAQAGQPADAAGRMPEHYSIDVWQVEDGLPENTVTSIVQTPDGYLWVGTLGGLARFDGVRFTTFAQVPGLGSQRVTQLHLDPAGGLWVGMEYGQLSRYHGGRFTGFSRDTGWPEQRAMTFASTAGGAMFVSTSQAVYRFEDGRFHPVFTDAAAGVAVPTQVVADEADRIWINREGKVGVLEDGAWRPFPANPPFGFTHRLTRGRHGGLWLSLHGGVGRWRDGRLTMVGETALPRAALTDGQDLMEDSLGRLWLPSWKLGLYCLLPDGSVQHFSRGEGMPEDSVRAVLEDREGNIWAGMNNGGLARIRPQLFHSLERSNSALTNIVFALAQEEGEGMLLGSRGNGLWRMEGNQITYVTLEAVPEPFGVWTIIPSRAGGHWAGVYGLWSGVVRLHEGRVERIEKGAAVLRDNVMALCEARDGTLWIGTQRGLCWRRDGVFYQHETEERLRSLAVRTLAEGADGSIWLGTMGGGLFRHHDGRFTHVGPDDGLSGDWITALHAETNGVVWAGTSAGLGRWNGFRWVTLSTQHGLPEAAATTLLDDGLGHLWLGTGRGIVRLAKKSFEAVAAGDRRQVESTAYSRSDGLASIQVAGGGVPGLRTRDGRLWFATIGGLSVVNPHELTANPVPPQVVIEEARVDGVEAAPAARKSKVGARTSAGSSIEEPPPVVEVPPRGRQVEVHYTGLSFTAPELVRFRYRLEGYDGQWQEAGTRRVAYYQGLPPGRYRFQVIAANNDGVWSEEGAVLGLVVRAAIWQTAWFRASIAGLLAGLALLFYRLRITQLERQQAAQREFSRRLIASQEQERKRIAAELHDSLGQDLLVIKNRAAMAVQSGSAGKPESGHLEEISRVAAQALEEVREISHNLRPYQLDRLGLTRALRGLAGTIAASTGLRCVADVAPVDRLFAPETEINLYRVVQEGLNNIVKHAGATEARVTVERLESRISVRIEDNGRGFDREAGTEATARSGGMGLSGIAERVCMLNGRLRVESAPGRGTRLLIDVPVGETAR